MNQTRFDSPVSRRDALKHLGAAALTPLALGDPLRSDHAASFSAQQTKVVDTHFHLWAADQTRFPFHPNAPYRPDYTSPLEQWLEDREGSGIDIGIFVHPEPYQDDHRYVVHCLERAPEVLRGTVLFDCNAADSPRRMEELIRGGLPFVAARIHSPDSAGRVADWRSRNFEAFWEKTMELSLVAQIHMQPAWSWELERMMERYPETRVAIDHLGRPQQGTPVDYEVLLNLSRFPNVYMKVSSLGGQSGQDPPYDNLKPLVREIVRRFSPARVMWGGSYRGGIGTSGYAQMLADANRLLDFLSPADRAMVLGGAAQRLFLIS